MDFVEDYNGYLADFGVHAALDGRPVRVIFDNAYAESFGMSVSTSTPRAGLPTAAAAPVQGSALVIGDASYRVTAVQPDGTGWTTLQLQEAA